MSHTAHDSGADIMQDECMTHTVTTATFTEAARYWELVHAFVALDQPKGRANTAHEDRVIDSNFREMIGTLKSAGMTHNDACDLNREHVAEVRSL